MSGHPLYVVVRPTPDQERERPAPERVAAQRSAARAALAVAAELADCPDRAFEKSGPRGKPLPTAAGWRWSISHDAGLVAAVVAPGFRVGVDLERIALRRRLLVERVADPDERAILGEGDEPLDAMGFARLWTAKEAVLKAETIGLPGLGRCRVVGAPSSLEVDVTYGGEPRTVLHTRVDDRLVSLCAVPLDGRLSHVVWDVPSRS
ncbi:MAG: 4'-phosphopantetheinyl transferase superfamily protein [Planctomycetota bacterium]